jgi:hypothetical protein
MNIFLKGVLQEINTVIIPGLGALTITSAKTGDIYFMPFLKHDDGRLASYISNKDGIEINEAKKNIALFVEEIKRKLDQNENYEMEEFGRFFLNNDGEVDFQKWEDYQVVDKSILAISKKKKEAETKTPSENTKEETTKKEEVIDKSAEVISEVNSNETVSEPSIEMESITNDELITIISEEEELQLEKPESNATNSSLDAILNNSELETSSTETEVITESNSSNLNEDSPKESQEVETLVVKNVTSDETKPEEDSSKEEDITKEEKPSKTSDNIVEEIKEEKTLSKKELALLKKEQIAKEKAKLKEEKLLLANEKKEAKLRAAEEKRKLREEAKKKKEELKLEKVKLAESKKNTKKETTPASTEIPAEKKKKSKVLVWVFLGLLLSGAAIWYTLESRKHEKIIIHEKTTIIKKDNKEVIKKTTTTKVVSKKKEEIVHKEVVMKSKDHSTNTTKVNNSILTSKEDISIKEVKTPVLKTMETPKQTNTSPKTNVVTPTQQSVSSNTSKGATSPAYVSKNRNIQVIAGSFKDKANAETLVSSLKTEGFESAHLIEEEGSFQVSLGSFSTLSESYQALKKYKGDTWIKKK